MDAQLRITADTRDDVIAALNELQEKFAARLTITQTVRRNDEGVWVAIARLKGGAEHDPEQAVHELDTQLGQEMGARDYLDLYGFDVVGMIMGEARTVYNHEHARPELQIQLPAGVVKAWRNGPGWVVGSPQAGPGKMISAEAGQLIGTLYNIMQVLLERP